MDKEVEEYLEARRSVTAHGMEFKQAGGTSRMEADRWCIAHGTPAQKYSAHKSMAKILFPDFVWFEDEPKIPWYAKWPDRTLKALCEETHVIITGPASGAKTATSALYAVQTWISDPVDTMVLVGSTTRTDARKRIWSEVCLKYSRWQDIFPGKLVDSHSIIKVKDGSPETRHLSETSSISLFAPESTADGAFNKLIGFKNKKVIVIADELTGMPASLIKALSNLRKNPWLQFVGIGNAERRTDVHGDQAEPLNGWDSISVLSHEWRNKHGGLTLHFDGLETPNKYTVPKDKYNFLITETDNVRDKADLGENSSHFYRMNRGFWSPGDATEGVFSEMEIISGLATTKAVWQTTKTKLISFDPSFSAGDRAMANVAYIGMGADGVSLLENDRLVRIQEDVTIKDVTPDMQIAQKFTEFLIEEQVEPHQVAMDATASGTAMASLVEELWGKKGILRIDFTGSPTDRDVNGKKATDLYYNYAAELWFSAKSFLRRKLIRGISLDLLDELVSRRLHDGQRALAERNTKLRIEPKASYKSRLGKSPDMADSFLMNLELARVRFGFTAGQSATEESSRRLTDDEFIKSQDNIWDMPMSLDDGIEDFIW
jgi:hypothetical protein